MTMSGKGRSDDRGDPEGEAEAGAEAAAEEEKEEEEDEGAHYTWPSVKIVPEVDEVVIYDIDNDDDDDDEDGTANGEDYKSRSGKQKVEEDDEELDKSGLVHLVLGLGPNFPDAIAVGSCDLWVARGTVRILGADIPCSSRSPYFLKMRSPFWSSLLCIAASSKSGEQSIGSGPAPKFFQKSSGSILSAIEMVEKHAPCVIVLRQVRGAPLLSSSAYTRRLFGSKYLNDWENVPHLFPGMGLLRSEGAPGLTLVHGLRQCSISESWMLAVERIKMRGETAPSVFVAGARGLGKSTFCRFVTNSLLTLKEKAYPSVAFLDTDIGQPEFTCPGFVSLTLIESRLPILSPAETQPRRQQLMKVFVGDISPRSNPDLYLASIDTLLLSFSTFLSQSGLAGRVPLVVNTHGWVKGLGHHLVEAIAARIGPNHFVKLEGRSLNKKFDLNISSATLHSLAGWSSENSAMVQKQQDSRGSTGPQPTLNATQLRNKRFSAYFRSLKSRTSLSISHGTVTEGGDADELDESSTTANLMANGIPFRARLDKVALCIMYAHVPPAYVLRVMSGTLVGLCIASEAEVSAMEPVQGVKIMHEPLVYPCVGLGIVHSTSLHSVFILTPVKESVLQKVNVLMVGNVSLPSSMLDWKLSLEASPYTDYGLSVESCGTGATPMSNARSRPVKRKRLGRS
eukprot:g2756.t1